MRRVYQKSPSFPLFITLLMAMVACAGALPPTDAGGGSDKTKSVFVAIHGWHSGIVVRTADIDAQQWPEIADFPRAEYVEIGWGDWDYYQADDPGVGTALKAAFWSRRSVLHVTGVSGAPERYFPASEIIPIVLSDEAFKRLVRFVSETFARSDAAATPETRSGWYPNSRFYPANGRFHLFRTCNTWVAEALHAADLPIAPAYAFTAANLGYQIRRLATNK